MRARIAVREAGVGDDVRELLARAAALVVDEGMEFAAARHKATRELRWRGPQPDHEGLEAAVREHIAIFHADTQPAELRALRELALQWMQRLAALRPHLAGAAWRGTATRRSALLMDLYCDDPKMAEIMLLNQGLSFDAGAPGTGAHGREAVDVLSLSVRCPAWPEPVQMHLRVNDLDALRGALKPDRGGRSWRGDAQALQRLLAGGAAEGDADGVAATSLDGAAGPA